MKVAIIHDWLVTHTGAEKVLSEIVQLYPEADIFSLVDFLTLQERDDIVSGKHVQTSFIQKLPFAKKLFRNYLPLFPMAIERLDIQSYDVIISSSWAVAKGVKTKNHQIHVNYCHTPIRYAWDLYDEYTKNLGRVKKYFVQQTLHYIRQWDYRVSNRVDVFIANSYFVQKRIRCNYGRDAVVIHPPVDTTTFMPRIHKDKERFYVTVSRLVPYKRVAMIVEAFNKNGRKLVVIGSGEEQQYITAMAEDNITILGWQKNEVIVDYLQRARAFVYAAEEDFGIVPVEAMACGTPVIAYGVGGVCDSVIEHETGIFFTEQTPEALNSAVALFETCSFNTATIVSQAKKFSTEMFRKRFKALMLSTVKERSSSVCDSL